MSGDKKKLPVEVVDLARFAAQALGYELPDPNPEVRRQWAVFEAMIALMTPQGFADLMGTMWPELIGAMPLRMGPPMRSLGRIPFALDLMRPMFPVLFPILLPRMMPKVMPVMLQRVAERIPMHRALTARATGTKVAVWQRTRRTQRARVRKRCDSCLTSSRPLSMPSSRC